MTDATISNSPNFSSVFSPTVVRNLNDKSYEKRKTGALEIEKLVRDNLATKNYEGVEAIIGSLVNDFTFSILPNSRNGGLIGLAATAIALGPQHLPNFLDSIIAPVLACFSDQDSNVRYYASESMYNICKVARRQVLRYFNDIFDALSKLTSDSSQIAKNGADLLDRLIKDIVAERTTSVSEEASITTPDTFSLPAFIPLLSERIKTLDPFARIFLISWISLLNSLPDLQLVQYLPDFINGMFRFLSDTNEEVRRLTQSLLKEFLREIKELEMAKETRREKRRNEQRRNDEKTHKHVNNTFSKSNIEETASLLAEACKANDGNNNVPVTDTTSDSGATPPITDESQEPLVKKPDDNSGDNLETGSASLGDFPVNDDEEAGSCDLDIMIDYGKISELLRPYLTSSDVETQAAALEWVNEFILLARTQMLPHLPMMINAVLPCLAASSGDDIRTLAKEINLNLLTMVSNVASEEEEDIKESPFDYQAMVNALTLQFLNEHEETRIAGLDWLVMLHKRAPKKVMAFDEGTFPALLKTLSDASEDVVKRDLLLLAISSTSSDEYFTKFMVNLLSLFSTDRKLLESRGSLIIRQLCLNLNSERIYRTFAQILENDEDLEFASTMVQNLNIILITSSEMNELRKKLKNLDSKEGQLLFVALYKSWCHNPVAAFSLCLLAQVYEHASNLLQCFADLDITVNFLIQVDKLVQLIESPVFTYLRLQLLEPDKHPYLFKCLYGILMLLPQSSAFATLRNRLNSISSMGVLHLFPSTTKKKGKTSPDSTLPTSASSSSNVVTAGVADFIKFPELLSHFRTIQLKHEAQRKLALNSVSLATSHGSFSSVNARRKNRNGGLQGSSSRSLLSSISSSSIQKREATGQGVSYRGSSGVRQSRRNKL